MPFEPKHLYIPPPLPTLWNLIADCSKNKGRIRFQDAQYLLGINETGLWDEFIISVIFQQDELGYSAIFKDGAITFN